MLQVRATERSAPSGEYSTDLLGASRRRTPEPVVSHVCWRTSLSDPDRPLTATRSARRRSSTERRRARLERNREAPLPKRCCTSSSRQQVERTPDAVAVAFDEAAAHLRELNARANRLAHTAARGAASGRTSLVGVCLERSLELVIALSASSRPAGPTCRSTPSTRRERLAYMLEDAGAPVLLTQDRLAATACPTHDAARRLPRSRRGTRSLRGAADATPASAVTPDNLAYVIYTSGSTGRPKGAMNTHRGIVNRLLLDAGRVPPGRRRPRAAEDAVQLRRLGLGVLLAADDRRRARRGPAGRPPGSAPTSPTSIAARARSPRSTSCPRCSRSSSRSRTSSALPQRCAA